MAWRLILALCHVQTLDDSMESAMWVSEGSARRHRSPLEPGAYMCIEASYLRDSLVLRLIRSSVKT